VSKPGIPRGKESVGKRKAGFSVITKPDSKVRVFICGELEPDRETARERAESATDTSDIVVYSDASGREGHLGAAIMALGDHEEGMEYQQIQAGPM
jgi:hypothetical protein